MSAAFGLTFVLLALVGAIRVVRCVLATARAIPGALRRALARMGRAMARLDAPTSAPDIAREVSLADVVALASARKGRKRAA